MSRTLPLTSLGFGLLFVVYIGMIGRAGEAPGAFFFGSSLGIACAGILACGLGLMTQRWATTQLSSRFILMIDLVIGFGSALAGSVLRVLGALGYAIPESWGGLLFGIGCLLFALAWTKIYASYHFIEALRCGSLALLTGIVFHILARLIPATSWEYGAYLALLCLSLVLGLYEILRMQDAETDNDEPAKNSSLRSRLVGLAKHAWAPLCGLGICSFLLGSLWMQAFPLDGGSPGLSNIAGLDSVGPLLAVGLICPVTFRIRTYEQARKLFWVVMPITAVIFLVTPSLEEVTLPYWNLLVSNLQNGGSVCLLLCTWALLLLATRTNGFSVSVVFGSCLALIAALSLLGAFTFGVFGLKGNVITVVMFILYMAAVILFLAWGGAEGRASTNQARTFFKSFIQSRCDRLAEAHSLTPRETELLVLLGRGHGYAYIAESLYISETTVRTHARNIYHKLGVSSQEELLGLIDHLDSLETH